MSQSEVMSGTREANNPLQAATSVSSADSFASTSTRSSSISPSSVSTSSAGTIVPEKYGRPITEIYAFALKFLKKHQVDLIATMHYTEKNMLFAYRKQVQHGQYDPSKMPDVGFFDFIGKDQRNAWNSLGSMNAYDAMLGVVGILENCSPDWSKWVVEAINEKLAEERRAKEKAEQEAREKLKKEAEDKRRKAEEQERERQLLLQQKMNSQIPKPTMDKLGSHESNHHGHSHENHHGHSHDSNGQCDSAEPEQKLKELESFILSTDPDNIAVVGRGEIASIRVSIPDDAVATLEMTAKQTGQDKTGGKWVTNWEFATEHYDIAFGVNFEYSTPSGPNGASVTNVIPLLPVLRRDSHLQVIRGSHAVTLPMKGVYILKFDNAYSMLRSKTLFYRIYSQPTF